MLFTVLSCLLSGPKAYLTSLTKPVLAYHDSALSESILSSNLHNRGKLLIFYVDQDGATEEPYDYKCINSPGLTISLNDTRTLVPTSDASALPAIQSDFVRHLTKYLSAHPSDFSDWIVHSISISEELGLYVILVKV
ncbi:MAG: hypothetical protein M1834_006757 [Cirrosporium novae-zelandiae]|nr:MAG: hypothetical protein M1834_006757 [Cirrosporium novae-zelandiae]